MTYRMTTGKKTLLKTSATQILATWLTDVRGIHFKQSLSLINMRNMLIVAIVCHQGMSPRLWPPCCCWLSDCQAECADLSTSLVASNGRRVRCPAARSVYFNQNNIFTQEMTWKLLWGFQSPVHSIYGIGETEAQTVTSVWRLRPPLTVFQNMNSFRHSWEQHGQRKEQSLSTFQCH